MPADQVQKIQYPTFYPMFEPSYSKATMSSTIEPWLNSPEYQMVQYNLNLVKLMVGGMFAASYL